MLREKDRIETRGRIKETLKERKYESVKENERSTLTNNHVNTFANILFRSRLIKTHIQTRADTSVPTFPSLLN